VPRDIVPVAPLLRELILAAGAALAVGNIAVIVRERRRDESDTRPRPNFKIVTLNIVVGAVLALWGFASILASRA
jgi:hypothetical protein